MRCLERDKRKIYYANRIDDSPMYDEYGNRSGEYNVRFTKPKLLMASVSTQTGDTEVDRFGVNLMYDKIIVTDNLLTGITEESVLWVDTLPVIKSDGSTDTPYDYVVTKRRDSLNANRFYLAKVNVHV